MNQRVAHINLDTENTLVIPAPKKLYIRIPVPEGFDYKAKYSFRLGDTACEGYLNKNNQAEIELKTSTGDAHFEVWPFGEDQMSFQWQLWLGGT